MADAELQVTKNKIIKYIIACLYSMVQRLEKVLQINTQFRQLTKERHSRTLRRHSQLEEKRDDNDEPGM